jgi:hypothetical protein
MNWFILRFLPPFLEEAHSPKPQPTVTGGYDNLRVELSQFLPNLILNPLSRCHVIISRYAAS